ncbi:MAG: cytochrome C assembly protein, partial [Alistipes sp.]|nr:cytochrome C assembly protein [Alistipes sp.]
MMWSDLIYFALPAVVCWVAGAAVAYRSRRVWPATALSVVGSLIFFAFIVGMWLTLERPPMRTMGETRLWYSFFLSVAGILVYTRWRYRWILSFSTMMSVVFICINLFKPEIHS